MIVEQTRHYKNRIKYNPINNSFTETNQLSLFYERECPYPYGWIKESGSPPGYHKDVILISEAEHGLGDQIEIKLIGIFKRADGDHKLVAVSSSSLLDDLSQLSEMELSYLTRLYPQIDEGEGWFGCDAIHNSDSVEANSEEDITTESVKETGCDG